jgi:hypothetical protein
MDYEKLFMMLSLSEKLMGHPRYAPVKAKIDKEIDAMVAGEMPKPEPVVQPAERRSPISAHAIPAEPEPIEEPAEESSTPPQRI